MSFLQEEDGFDDPLDFSSTHFQKIDEHLRCPICKELYNTTMMLNTCSHSFCALCIRRSLTTEQVCPKCRKPAYENNLIHNYDLDNVVNTWRDSRKSILTLEQNANSKPKYQPVINEDMQQQLNEKLYQSLNSAPMVIDDDETDDFVPKKSITSKTGSTRRSTRLKTIQPENSQDLNGNSNPLAQTSLLPVQNGQTTQQSIPNELKTTSMVQCPICSQCMKYNVLDKHIDGCLQGDSRIPPSPPRPTSSILASSSSSSKMIIPKALKKSQKPVDLGKKPVKQVYSMMNDKELRECLRSLNLPDHGDKALKIWRHKEYLNLYNANYDSQNPVSAHVLIQRLQAIENSQYVDKTNQLKRKLADVDTHKSKYADHFSSLIESAKKNKNK